MKRLLILTILGMLLGGAAGCRFMDCLWRGPPCQQQPVVVCPNPCPTTYNPCDPCGGATAIGTPAMVMPGPRN